jgi:hypothetical protein
MFVMSVTVHRTAEITVNLPRDRAMAFFTAEGERRWADGWEPHYPALTRRDGPGAVFTTEHAGHQTTWIMVDHQPERIRYARVTHGVTAGIVAVDVVASDEQITRLRVSYDLTALSAVGETWLADFDATYESEIASWAIDIAASLRRDG